MKKFIASASLVAVGAAGLQGADAPVTTPTQTSKAWSVAASLRGFYDDNYATAPANSSRKDDSFGIEVAPMASINLPWEQSYLGASYRYSMKFYEGRQDNRVDQSHQFSLNANHRFTERYNMFLNDTFVYSEEPELIDPDLGSPIRTDADALRNNVRIGFNASLTEVLGLGVSYFNRWVDYIDDGPGSRSALLDRLEHLINLDGKYKVREDITTLIGYQFGAIDYTADEALFAPPPGSLPDMSETSDLRNNTSHYLYAGVDGDLTANLNTALRIGAQYTDFNNLDEDSTTPYVNWTVTYTYLPGSYFQAGITHRRVATDIQGSPGDVVTDETATSIFGEINHRITAKLTGNVFVQGQRGEFQGGAYEGDTDNFLLVGVNLDYQINQFLAAEASYFLDRLDSDIPSRSFTRNRVFIGLRASY